VPAPKITEALLTRYMSEGRGLGFGEDYRSFIQLARWNASPVSVQTIGRVPPFRRRMHFLSRSEWLIALLLAWIGCHVREQVPMWPWRSPHLLCGLNASLDPQLPWSPGTLALSASAGVRHGYFIGTRIPYIWTLDLVATMAWLPPEEITAAVVSVKPLSGEQYTGDTDPLSRGPEKLEVERLFSQALLLPYFVADRTLFPRNVLGQLELFSAGAYLDANSSLLIARDELLRRRGATLEAEPPCEWQRMLQTDHDLTENEAGLVVHNIIWHQLIDVDLSRELQMEDQVAPGGRKLQNALRCHLLERASCCR
jgi:hypothetical protein